MKKFILAIVQKIVRAGVRTLMFVTPAHTQIRIYERILADCRASEKFTRAITHYLVEKLCYNLNPDGEKPEVPDVVKLYNAFVFAHDTLSAVTPPRPNEKRRTFEKVPTL